LKGVYGPLLVNHAWPQLRCLKSGHDKLDGLAELDTFLDAVLIRPAAVFPQLELLDARALDAQQARKLLTLLDRGALPSLVSLRRSAGFVGLWRSSAHDTHNAAQQVAILRRLPATESLSLGAEVAPFAELISSGGLPNLKCVRDCMDVHVIHLHLFLSTRRIPHTQTS
jgi:hypothetical protein